MFKRLFTLFALSLICALMVAPVAAHEGRVIDDTYEIAFGWYVEPAYAGMANGPDLYITLHGDHERRLAGALAAHGEDGEARETLEALVVDLQAEVTFGGESMTLTLEPDFPTYLEFDGVGYVRYTADLVPTLPGDYTWRIFGTIGESEVDEVFDSADGEFSTIEPAQDIMFPSEQSMEARLAALEARIAELEALVETLSGS
jgi:hypothetical protein